MPFSRRCKGPNHQCSRCRKVFCHPMDLDQHINLVHTLQKKFYCFLCEFSCLSTKYLKWHCFKEHSVRDKDTFRRDYDWKGQLRKIQLPNKFTCSNCSAVFWDKTYLQLHRQRLHRTEKNFSCSMCKYTFKHAENLRSHVASHMAFKPFQCSTCQYKCRSMLLLKWHKQNVHQNLPSTTNKFKKHSDQTLIKRSKEHFFCPKCKETFASAIQVQQHAAQVHNKVNGMCFECNQCHGMFRDERSLNSHLKIHGESPKMINHQVQAHKIYLHHCEYCEYQTDYDFNLNRHLKVKHLKSMKNKQPVQPELVCTECQKSYKSNSLLDMHRISVHAAKLHHCEFCVYKTNTICNLRRHLRGHTNEKPFECTICFKSFSERAYLKKHERYVHGDDTKQPCTICNREFKYPQSLKVHILKFHQQQAVQ